MRDAKASDGGMYGRSSEGWASTLDKKSLMKNMPTSCSDLDMRRRRELKKL